MTKKQREFLQLHYEEDLSLREIAESFGITRQAVHDSIRSSEIALERYEKGLGLLSDFQRQRGMLTDILEHLQRLETDLNGTEKMNTIQYIKKRIHILMNPSEPQEEG